MDTGVQVRAVINVHECKCKVVNEVRGTDENAAQTQQYPDPADSESFRIMQICILPQLFLWCSLFFVCQCVDYTAYTAFVVSRNSEHGWSFITATVCDGEVERK